MPGIGLRPGPNRWRLLLPAAAYLLGLVAAPFVSGGLLAWAGLAWGFAVAWRWGAGPGGGRRVLADPLPLVALWPAIHLLLLGTSPPLSPLLFLAALWSHRVMGVAGGIVLAAGAAALVVAGSAWSGASAAQAAFGFLAVAAGAGSGALVVSGPRPAPAGAGAEQPPAGDEAVVEGATAPGAAGTRGSGPARDGVPPPPAFRTDADGDAAPLRAESAPGPGHARAAPARSTPEGGAQTPPTAREEAVTSTAGGAPAAAPAHDASVARPRANGGVVGGMPPSQRRAAGSRAAAPGPTGEPAAFAEDAEFAEDAQKTIAAIARLAVPERRQEVARALAGLRLHLRAGRLVVWDADLQAGLATPVLSSGGPLPPETRLEGDPLAWAAREHLPLRLEHAPRWAPDAAHAAVAPVAGDARSATLLSVELDQAEPPPSSDRLQEAAEYLGAFLRMHAREVRAVERERLFDRVLEVLRGLPGELDPEATARGLAESAAALAGGTGAAVATWRGEQGEVLARVGEDGGPDPGAVFGGSGSEMAVSARGGAIITRLDSRSPDRLPLTGDAERWRTRPRWISVLPLADPGGVVVGVLAVWGSGTAEPAYEGLAVLRDLGPLGALHLQHALQYRSLRHGAEADRLTTGGERLARGP